MRRSGPFFTAFFTHGGAMGLRIRQQPSSPGRIFAIAAFCHAVTTCATPATTRGAAPTTAG